MRGSVTRKSAPARWQIAQLILLVSICVLSGTGCHRALLCDGECPNPGLPIVPENQPRELFKVALPEYVIEPPDILLIEALHVIPRPPYELRTGDVIFVDVTGTVPEAPISGAYPIQLGGLLQFGPPYGSVRVSGMTLEEADRAIEEQLQNYLTDPQATVTLVEIAAQQQISGEHLVKPDGTVTLGTYGSVSLVGLTLDQARETIEQHLSQYLEDPEVSVDVFAYNSKIYYVVTEGAGLGDRVTRFPITGNETVLDAISNVAGLNSFSSKRIWIARPTPHADEVQILPVDWKAISSYGATTTNYQLMPGDRVFIAENKLVAFDTSIAKITAPLERIMGFILLTTGTVSRLSGNVLDQQSGGLGTGF